MKDELIIASENEGKILEAQEILNNYNIIPMKQYDIQIEVEEDEDTFEGNAIKKAETIAKILEGRRCISDDSGIEIEYLNGFPGVQTKRWLSRNRQTKKFRNFEKIKRCSKRKTKYKIYYFSSHFRWKTYNFCSW